jgi:hypothetical protein
MIGNFAVDYIHLFVHFGWRQIREMPVFPWISLPETAHRAPYPYHIHFLHDRDFSDCSFPALQLRFLWKITFKMCQKKKKEKPNNWNIIPPIRLGIHPRICFRYQPLNPFFETGWLWEEIGCCWDFPFPIHFHSCVWLDTVKHSNLRTENLKLCSIILLYSLQEGLVSSNLHLYLSLLAWPMIDHKNMPFTRHNSIDDPCEWGHYFHYIMHACCAIVRLNVNEDQLWCRPSLRTSVYAESI